MGVQTNMARRHLAVPGRPLGRDMSAPGRRDVCSYFVIKRKPCPLAPSIPSRPRIPVNLFHPCCLAVCPSFQVEDIFTSSVPGTKHSSQVSKHHSSSTSKQSGGPYCATVQLNSSPPLLLSQPGTVTVRQRARPELCSIHCTKMPAL